MMNGVTYYATKDEAERQAEIYRKRVKVKTDVFYVEHDPEKGYYIEQDMGSES